MVFGGFLEETGCTVDRREPVRSKIITRLYEAGKAAYSDLLDSAGLTEVLDSRGDFNYHLNFLLQNSIATKDGVVYHLRDRGRAIDARNGLYGCLLVYVAFRKRLS